MTLVRRLAIHGAWLAAVTACAVAVAFLAAAGLTAIARVIQGSSADLWSEVRGYVAFAVGAGLVAVPAWLVVRRILRRLLAEPGELASATHALASLAASGLAIIVAVQLVGMGASLLAMEASFSDGSEASLAGIVPIAAGLVGGLVWLLVAAARVREVAVARPVGIAAGITRVALYGPLVYFVGLTVSSVAQTLTLAVGLLDPGAAGGVISYEPDPYEANYVLLGGLVPALAAAIALIPHAWYARRLVGKSRPFAPEEVAALTRRAAWALVALSSLGWLLAGLTGVLTAAVRAVLDVPGLSALGAGPGAEAAAAALGLLPALVVAAIGWAWHRAEVRRWVPGDLPRAARTWGYALAWDAIGFAAVGAAQLLAFLLTWAFAPGRAALDGPDQVAAAVPYLVVGTGAWAIAWWRAGRRLAADPREALSTARRAFLGGTILSGFVALLIGLPWALVPVLDQVLGGTSVGLVDAVAVPFAIAIVGAGMAAGALMAWDRDDTIAGLVEVATDVPPTPSGPIDAPPAPPEPPDSRPAPPEDPAASMPDEPAQPTAVENEPPAAPH